jgi:CCR4-NOT transcription complex subunit 6
MTDFLLLLMLLLLLNSCCRYHSYCPNQYLEWRYRLPHIAAELLHYNADILCLQEVETPVFQQQLEPLFHERGYVGLHHPRPSPPGTPGPDEGVSLFFRSSLFNHVSSKKIVFSDESSAVFPQDAYSEDPSSSFKASDFARVLARRREGAILALLQHKPSQRYLVACSTHLFWDPTYPDVKAAQGAVLCAAAAAWMQQQLGEQQQQVPVIIGGDFNSMWRKYESDIWDKVSLDSRNS